MTAAQSSTEKLLERLQNAQEHVRVTPATADEWMKDLEDAKELLYDTICGADDQDNTEFFVRAYELMGEVVDVVLMECGRSAYRNIHTGARRPKDESNYDANGFCW
jgi:hypothetical protein